MGLAPAPQPAPAQKVHNLPQIDTLWIGAQVAQAWLLEERSAAGLNGRRPPTGCGRRGPLRLATAHATPRQ